MVYRDEFARASSLPVLKLLASPLEFMVIVSEAILEFARIEQHVEFKVWRC